MLRTRIPLTEVERVLLDRASAATGRSMASLIREAVREHWGGEPASADDLAALDAAFGARGSSFPAGDAWVDGLRSGDQITTS